ncbi:MAG: protein-export membrane protein SecF [Candidatus Aquicultor primus]|uniref:Protein-export membrane protein SecF n=1 Tax=Candidatus Aquicultor primus TaxID=1797195 RepID=A0A1F2US42_9ACTN|nr:MAG: protein-export membrane protein SecF [Candidatus Aquicultor primus]HCG98386.1 protein translocase subunit SecF [Actinomycetota bacterium]
MLKFDFIGKKNIWFGISAAIIVLSLVGMLVIGFNYSIDFKGGSSSEVRFKKAVSVEDVRSVLKEQGLGDSKIQPIENILGTDVGALSSTTKGTMMLLRTTELSTDQETAVFKALDTKFGISDRQTMTVDASWGALITERAIYAFVAALVLLLIFITVRYEFKMSVAAILALFHDIIITAGVYVLVGREVNPNMIAALITILGYSLYDTIVVFHRIKENSPNIVRTTYSAMANKSINQVLMRSINTSLTTLLPIIAILLFGGETLKDFAFALMVGTIAGTYSSIFFASPLFVVWKEAEPYYRNLKNKYGKEAIARASTS